MPFEKKSAEAIKSEVVSTYGFDEEQHKPIIDQMVKDRMKDEDMKESLYKQKKTAQQKLEEVTKQLDETKSKGQGEIKTKEEIRQIVAEEQFLAQGGTNTALRQLHKIMTATGKSFVEAQKDSLFVAFKKEQDRVLESRESQLPPSRGGSNTPKKEVDDIASRNEGNLPPGFEVKK